MKGKSKNKIFFPNLILLGLGLVVIVYSAFNILNLGLMKGNTSTVLNTLENDYYVVGKDPTALQKEKFELLTEELEKDPRDYLKISELVSESFVIDFFNWSNKDAPYDVGGLQYMYDPSTFNKIAHFEYYQKLDMFKSTYGKDQLPELIELTTKTEKTKDYTIGDKTFEAYHAKVSWKYADSKKLETNKFVNECELILVNDDGMIKIVEVKMTDEVDANINDINEDTEVGTYE